MTIFDTDCPKHPPYRRAQPMDAGELGPAVQAFLDHLAALGHTSSVRISFSKSARHFAEWLSRTGVPLAEVCEETAGQFACHDCQCPGNRHPGYLNADYITRVRRFIGFLAESGRIACCSGQTEPLPIDERILEFQEWLRQHRGIGQQTICGYSRSIKKLFPILGNDPAVYEGALIRRVILDEWRKEKRPDIKRASTALRFYLRFLATKGWCRPGLEQAVPTIAHWRLSALPRYLQPSQVEQLVASCDLSRPTGIRDRAILLLLARLGLRAGDIVKMRLEDIEWEEGTLRVCGKGRRETRLPLPQEVGEAILEYLDKVRPEVAVSQIFLRIHAPHRPLSQSSTIAHVVGAALDRAGISDPPSRGAHLLRYSAATTMLWAGAPLYAIGAVLRHRSTDMTAHYAKVNLPMLHGVVQPWPGGVPC